ncbi:MAG: DUF3592 domain-containing protein [Arachnia sp.]
MRWWMVIAVLAIIGAIVVCVVGLVRDLLVMAQQRARGITTMGTVVAITERGEAGEGPMTSRLPTVNFTDRNGRSRTFDSRDPVDNCPDPGGTLAVWYDPDDDAAAPEVLITRKVSAVAGYIFGIVVGVVLLVGFNLFASVWGH